MSSQKTIHEDLGLFIVNELTKRGHPDPYQWQKGLKPEYRKETSEIQKLLINQHLRFIIGQYPDTTETRFYVDDHVGIVEWKTLMRNAIIPWLMLH